MMTIGLLTSLAMVLAGVPGTTAQPCPEVRPPEGPWTGTPLHDAIRRNDASVARRLMTAATINQRDSFGDTPLVAALTPAASLEPAGVESPAKAHAQFPGEKTARQAIVSALLAKGASVNEPGSAGTRPLTQLAGWGFSPTVDSDLVKKLLRLGAEVNARDDSGTTALMLAARRGKDALVRVLLSKGADPELRNCHGESAASLARVGGHPALARLLSVGGGRGR
jgi:ankyrin repeat protein